MCLPRVSHVQLLLNRDEKPNYEQRNCLQTYHPLLIFETFLLLEHADIRKSKKKIITNKGVIHCQE